MKINNKGFSAVEFILLTLVIGLVGAVGWLVLQRSNDSSEDKPVTSQQSTDEKKESSAPSGYIAWEWTGDTWEPFGSAPDCEEPYEIVAPMDASKASSLLYPGQVRGGNYKPHGGLGAEKQPDGFNTAVVATQDIYLYRGSRYIERGALQYMLDFIDSCGFLHRYDHLATVSDDMKQYVDQLPEAKVDESQTNKFTSNPFIKQGTVIATQIGTKNNPGFDYGLYDLRQPNAASKTEKFKTDPEISKFNALSYHAVCWFDYLNDADKSIIKSLPPRGAEGTTSDYCK